MGIARAAYRLLLEEKKRGTLKGKRILQLGRQCILFDHATLLKYAQKHNVNLVPVKADLSFDSHYKKLGFIDDQTLFQALGFEDVKSLDYSDFEGADIVWDLNTPIPDKYWDTFDVIYDGGTAEHVFNFPEVLANIHRLLKKNGCIIHVSPSHNHVDHGFYMFSPQVYSEYYLANQYTILTSQIFEYTPKITGNWDIYDYKIGALDALSGGFGSKMLAIHIVAKKTEVSTCHVAPQQGSYVRAWKAKKKMQSLKKVNPISRLGISLKKKISKRVPHSIKVILKKRKLRKVSTY